jgi:hypothetical protein
MNDAGGRQLRAMHGIELKKGKGAASVFSNDSLRMIGFNPLTGREYVFRQEEQEEVENGKVEEKEVKKVKKVAPAAEKADDGLIYLSDSDSD